MRLGKKLVSAIVVLTMSTTVLTGCTSSKKAITETAEQFLEIVQSGSTENIEAYASAGVLEGEFVRTFDSTFLTDNLKSGIESDKLDEATAQRLDNLCASLSNMITGYEIKSATVKKGVGTVIASVDTGFPLNVIGSEDASARIGVKVDAYKEANPDKIDNSDPEIAKQAYNDLINLVLETYEDVISESSEETYIFVFTITKDPDSHDWSITEIQDYDSAANGKVIAETNTEVDTSEVEEQPADEEAPAEDENAENAEEAQPEETNTEAEGDAQNTDVEEVDLSID
ncbi:hypothetical protein [Butyrivibrio sp. AE2005]|uniref:hypothetical protein n=1 Tax=Butyrivibrio sp. AE2005 TaxID=1496722 RepID=UPI000479CF1B|nr:hypothetical protein [Butyrivibrio sp. AE2005]